MWIAIILDDGNYDVQRKVVGNTKEEAINSMKQELIDAMVRINKGVQVFNSDAMKKTRKGSWDDLRKQWTGKDNYPSLHLFEV